jgi:O-antigen ligase
MDQRLTAAGVPVALGPPASRREVVKQSAIPFAAMMMPLIVGGFVDVPRSIPAGPVSFMGLMTICEAAGVGIGLLSCLRYPRFLAWRVLPFATFLAWALVRSSIEAATIPAIQNGAVYILFGLAVTLSGTLVARFPAFTSALINKGVRWIDHVALSLVAVSVLTDGLPVDGQDWLMGPRSIALLGLIPLSWHIARWHYGYAGSGIRTLLWVAAILSSLSRTASAVALLYLLVMFILQLLLRTRRMVIRLPFIIGTAALIVVIVSYLPLRDRFLTGDTSIRVGTVAVNASGRLDIWAIVIASGMRSPVVGQGLGSSNVAVMHLGSTVGHPHNDYLRVWHDLGYIGVVLLVIAFLSWLLTLARSWIRTRHQRDDVSALRLAAFLALLALALVAVTDNALVYPFIMGPLGVIVGGGLGASKRNGRTS